MTDESEGRSLYVLKPFDDCTSVEQREIGVLLEEGAISKVGTRGDIVKDYILWSIAQYGPDVGAGVLLANARAADHIPYVCTNCLHSTRHHRETVDGSCNWWTWGQWCNCEQMV